MKHILKTSPRLKRSAVLRNLYPRLADARPHSAWVDLAQWVSVQLAEHEYKPIDADSLRGFFHREARFQKPLHQVETSRPAIPQSVNNFVHSPKANSVQSNPLSKIKAAGAGMKNLKAM